MVISDEVCALAQVDPEAFGLDGSYEPRLGCATTRELLTEIAVRIAMGHPWYRAWGEDVIEDALREMPAEVLDYRTIDI